MAGLFYPGRVILLIIVCSLVRAFFAFTLELGNDEAYYWLYSLHLQWSYFDHPPMVAVWVNLFTANLALQQYEGLIRLGSIAGCALSTWFIFKTVTLLHTERAGWFAACLFNASFYAGIIAGILIMPDSPQIVFWTFCLWMIARIIVNDRKWINWILFGIAAGLCIMSKVHGAFIWLGLGMYILFKRISWLTKPQLYVAMFLTLVITSPILLWNIQNDFITWRFHSERVTIKQFSFNTKSFLTEFFGQLMFNNPFNVTLILSALIARRKKQVSKCPALPVYNFIALPLALVLLFVSFFRNTLPHWNGPAYIALIPLAAIRLAEINKTSLYPKWLRWSLGSFILFLIAWILVLYYYPGTYGNKNESNLGAGDVTLDRVGWREAGKQFAVLYQDEISKGITPAGAPVVTYKWWGAHIEYYFCRPTGIQMIGMGKVNDLHQYWWLNKWRKDKVNFTAAYCIVASIEKYNVQRQYAGYYRQVDSVTAIQICRNDKPAHYFYVYRLRGWKNQLPPAP